MITNIDDKIIGRTIWFFHPRKGITYITVTGVYHVTGRKKESKWGLWYDDVNGEGKVISKIIWVRDWILFESRLRCEKWVRAMLAKSAVDKQLDKAMGLE